MTTNEAVHVFKTAGLDTYADHAAAAGALCVRGDDPPEVDGSCVACGVTMSTCETCLGVGYHRALCIESDESTDVRILILGGPKTGKTTLASRVAAVRGLPLKHTDDLAGIAEWSEASAIVAGWFDEPGSFVVEGVAGARALRKWMAAHEGKPVDVVIVCDTARVERTKGQNAMAKGCVTVWTEIRDELARRGVRIETF